MDIYYILTEKCNLQCSFCIRKLLDNKKSDFISLDRFQDSVAILLKMFERSTIVLTGGEPFLHPKFSEILSIASERFDRVVINTNGTFGSNFVETLKPYLSRNVFIQFSIDGTEEVHDTVRGSGTYRKCISNIKFLEDCYNHISLSITIGKYNKNSIPFLLKELNDYRFHHLKLSPAHIIDKDLTKCISSIEWNNMIDEILPLCHYRLHAQKLFCFDIWEKYLLKCHGNLTDDIHFNCGIGKDKIYVRQNGDIQLCTCFNENIGNLFVTDNKLIKQRLLQKSKNVIDKSSECAKCKFLKICNGGCPGYSKKFFNKTNMGDPRCPMINNTYEKRKNFIDKQM